MFTNEELCILYSPYRQTPLSLMQNNKFEKERKQKSFEDFDSKLSCFEQLDFLSGIKSSVEAQYSSLLQTTFKPVLGLFLEIKFVTGTHARSIDVLP